MNILIKLTCLIGLVIAPILGNGNQEKEAWVKDFSKGYEAAGKCDMTKMTSMTKDQCAAMCDSLKCSPYEKQMCLSHYGADGKFITEEKMDCCAKKGEGAMTSATADKNVKVVITNTNGKAKATVTTTVNKTSTSQTFEGTEAEVKAKVDALK